MTCVKFQFFVACQAIETETVSKTASVLASGVRFSTLRKKESSLAQHDHLAISLETIEGRFLRDEVISEEECRVLLASCSHPDKHLREAALTLLFHPPTTDILSSYRHLLGFFTTNCRNLQELPHPLWELLCEFVAVCGQVPQEPATALFFKRVLTHLPSAFMRSLLSQSLPLKPFLACFRLSSFRVFPKCRGTGLTRRWRFLHKKLSTGPAAPSWAQLTFADLGCLFGRKHAVHRCGYPSGRWLVRGRPLLLPQAETPPPPGHIAVRHCTWGGAGAGVRRYMDRLLSVHVKELRRVRALAQTVSHHTRRVVLSWHNATLAASSGWAFEDVSDQFSSRALWKTFQTTVRSNLHSRQNAPQSDPKANRNLGQQWQQRLVVPKVHHALWEERACALLNLTCEAEWQKHLGAAEEILRLPGVEFSSACRGYGWTGPVSPHQCLPLHTILDWSARREEAWHGGLLRLAALLQEGQLLLDKGLLHHLVLPWIDKFFISSRREDDWEYLSTLVGWFEEQGLHPLILFWEDTPHRQEPTLKLVLKQLSGQGRAFRGIGVFDWRGSSRTEALQIICREHHQTSLFALRPFSDCHNFHSFQQLLEDRPHPFFQDYDSSWKDGLCFLYAGTQVFPLLSIPTDRENLPAWIASEGDKYPFGSYWRSRLREAVLGKRPEAADPLSVSYAMWGNLC